MSDATAADGHSDTTIMKEHRCRPDVVVIGGGFDGIAVAKWLRKHGDRFRVTVLSEHNYKTFNPLLPEVVSTSVLPGQVVAPLKEMHGRNQRSIMGRVVGANFERKCTHVEVGKNLTIVPYDHVVLAVGARARLDLVPGLQEHAIPPEMIGDAMRIRNSVIAQLESADHLEDEVARRQLRHFVVVGGGCVLRVVLSRASEKMSRQYPSFMLATVCCQSFRRSSARRPRRASARAACRSISMPKRRPRTRRA